MSAAGPSPIPRWAFSRVSFVPLTRFGLESAFRIAFSLATMNWTIVAGEQLMKSGVLFGVLAGVVGAASMAFAAQSDSPKETAAQPSPPPAKPVTETLWGQKVTDDYRDMEKAGPETMEWMKKEGAYTRRLFDSIPARAALGKRVADFTGSF